MKPQASAYLWTNGNACFFDDAGEQISEMQRHGWAGLHQFVARYPDAPVSLARWHDTALPVTSVENVLKSLRVPAAEVVTR
jgi:hypothetical protein